MHIKGLRSMTQLGQLDLAHKGSEVNDIVRAARPVHRGSEVNDTVRAARPCT